MGGTMGRRGTIVAALVLAGACASGGERAGPVVDSLEQLPDAVIEASGPEEALLCRVQLPRELIYHSGLLVHDGTVASVELDQWRDGVHLRPDVSGTLLLNMVRPENYRAVTLAQRVRCLPPPDRASDG